MCFLVAQDVNMISPKGYIVNSKSNGKVHLSITDDKGKQRLKCGWRISKTVSLVFGCHGIKYGELCKKCFPPKENPKEHDAEQIEQYDDVV